MLKRTSKKKPLRRKPAKKQSILDSVYEAAKDLNEAGLITPVTMHEFEALCKEPAPSLSPAKIKKIRLKEGVSQPVFAWYLNVKPTTVKKWETGENCPSGAALRLLNVVQAHGLDHIITH